MNDDVMINQDVDKNAFAASMYVHPFVGQTFTAKWNNSRAQHDPYAPIEIELTLDPYPPEYGERYIPSLLFVENSSRQVQDGDFTSIRIYQFPVDSSNACHILR